MPQHDFEINVNPKHTKLGLYTAGAVFLLIFFFIFSPITTVEAGHVKVATLFGKVKTSYKEGLHIVNPLYKFHTYDLRQKTIKMSKLPVPSQDQLITNFDISIQYRVNGEMATQILAETGTARQLVEVHLIPKFRSLLREISKGVETAEMFYLKEVQQNIQANLTNGLQEFCAPVGLSVQEILIREVELPLVISQAVEKKKRRQQQAEEQKAELARFKVEQEQKLAQAEAERKAAEEEAKKIRLMADAEAYRIQKINAAVARNPAYVQLQAIEAMEQISKNPAHQIYFVDGQSPTPLPLMHMGDRK
jgi:regulator of protease activity HflC (stomatin/prohibitin superfamily)